jgi:hypothetical protein
MTLRQYLLWMLLSTALCWLGWFSVVEAVDPTESGWIGYAAFYAALCLALVGTFSVIGLAARSLLRRHEPISRHAATSFRQSLLLTVFLAGSLVLQSHALLTWWNLLLFVATLTIAEFFLISFRSGR